MGAVPCGRRLCENHNIAEENRARLIEMISLWYMEAGKYNVLPINTPVRPVYWMHGRRLRRRVTVTAFILGRRLFRATQLSMSSTAHTGSHG